MFFETNFHLVGIGGIGMSGLARILRAHGKTVRGSDLEASPVTEKLASEGFEIQFSQSSKNLAPDTEVVIRTTAVREDNPEIIEAQKRGLKILTYPEALGIITREKKLIAIAGAHGKTTTTSLIISACLAAGEDISCLVGTNLRELDGGNARVGSSEWFVLEACEYRRAFLNLAPQILVVTNIEAEHLDYYRDLADYVSAFVALAGKLPSDGALVANSAEPNLEAIIRIAPKFVDSSTVNEELKMKNEEGIKNKATSGHFVAEKNKASEIPNTKYQTLPTGRQVPNLRLSGEHNRKNAALALRVAELLHLDLARAKNGIENFAGGWRRFEFRGEFQGAEIYDDYGHHPTEIRATLAGAREKFPARRIVVVYQQHQLDRAAKFLKELGEGFADADVVVIPNIYRVRDEDKELKITAEDLVHAISTNGKEAHHTHDFPATVVWLCEHVKKDDVVIVMGAGDVYQITEALFDNV